MDPKPGYKTVSFWLASIATLGAAMMASGAGLGSTASSIALLVSGLGAAGYAAYRAFAKSADPAKPAYKTSEFWLSVVTALISILYASGLVSVGGTLEQVIGFASALLALAGYQVTKPKV